MFVANLTKIFSPNFTAPNIFSATNIRNIGDKVAKIPISLLLCTKLNIIDNNSGAKIKIYGKDKTISFIVLVRYNIINYKNTIQRIQNKTKNTHGYKLKNHSFFFE
jgi:hypothetical protein